MHERLTQESGTNVYTGTELLLKGALEAGVNLLTGYPGSPVADFFDLRETHQRLLEKYGIIFQIANNEALAAARLNGSQMGGLKAMAVMKSLGFHVASDGLALGNLAKAKSRGGAVVVIGDDPWTDSTQVPADSRFLAQHLQVPILEPSTSQELKDWIKFAFELSEKSDLYLGYIVTTNQVEGGGTVTVSPNQRPAINANRPFAIDTSSIPQEETVLLPPRTGQREETLDFRMNTLLAVGRTYSLNQILYTPRDTAPLGFITAGLAYCYLEQALRELGIGEILPILKLGMTYPIDDRILREFLLQVDEIVVVEERRGFLESQIATVCKDLFQAGLIPRSPKIWGKKLPGLFPGLPDRHGLNPSILIERLAPLLLRIEDSRLSVDRDSIQRAVRSIRETAAFKMRIPARLPTFCPGCPHRDSGSVLKDIKRDFLDPKYMKRNHQSGPVDLVFHGDTGCYTMLMFEPYSEIFHSYSGMGLGGGTGAGIQPFIKNKQIAFMGDSTFFHSGMIAISDSIKHRQDITYIILDNKTTAMTGHQPTPGNSVDVMGYSTVAQNIEAIVEGMAHGTEIPVVRTNPAYRDTYRALIERMVLKEGVKVIIADKECGITYHRRMKSHREGLTRQGKALPDEVHINITPEVCEFCLECTKATACPGLTTVETDYGPKVAIDRSSCVADSACMKIRACPSFERVIIRRGRPRMPLQQNGIHDMPDDPPTKDFDGKWSAYIAGVGGMGVGVLTSILVQAGMREGYTVRFTERKGLAIRNGGVYSQVIFAKNGFPESPIISYGMADLLLGIDILEAARSLDARFNLRVASPRKTAAVINRAKTPTVTSLLGRENFDPHRLEKCIQPLIKNGEYFSEDFSSLSEELLGNKIYGNLSLLGAAYQAGLLPFRLENILWAIERSVPLEEHDKNLEAFKIGRQTVVRPVEFGHPQEQVNPKPVWAEKRSILARTRGEQLASEYETVVTEIVTGMRLDDITKDNLALRLYDMIQYGDIETARSYATRIVRVYRNDREEFNWEATKVVISELHRVMVIKDEVYVAHLLTSPEKLERDRKRYNLDGAHEDQIRYEHFTYPAFSLFGRDFEFSWKSKPWQLRILRRMKFLRRIVPGWHRREHEFRDWYQTVVDGFTHHDAKSYRRYVKALQVPEIVRGYRTVRYPKMDEARELAENLLNVSDVSAAESIPITRKSGIDANRHGTRWADASTEEAHLTVRH